MTDITIHQYELKILEKHLDTFGHINNATYLELYEEARWDLITSHGWGLESVLQRQIGPIILAINIQYKREIKNRELVKIETKVGSFKNRKILIILQRMLNQDGVEVNSIELEIGLFDLKNRRLLAPTDEWMESLGIRGNWREMLP